MRILERGKIRVQALRLLRFRQKMPKTPQTDARPRVRSMKPFWPPKYSAFQERVYGVGKNIGKPEPERERFKGQ
jgi:hypothetical protein